MKKLVATLALLLAAACGKPFEASVEAKEVCVKQTGETITIGGAQALAGTGLAIPGDVQTITLDAAEIQDLLKDDVAAQLSLQSFHLTAPAGKLEGLDKLHVVMKSPTGGADITLIDYDKAAGTQGGLIRIEGDQISGNLAPLGTDIVSYLKQGDVQLTVEAAGTMPTGETWTGAAVEVCAAAKASYDYGKHIGL